MWKVRVEIYLCPKLNYGCHWTDFHETLACSVVQLGYLGPHATFTEVPSLSYA